MGKTAYSFNRVLKKTETKLEQLHLLQSAESRDRFHSIKKKTKAAKSSLNGGKAIASYCIVLKGHDYVPDAVVQYQQQLQNLLRLVSTRTGAVNSRQLILGYDVT